MTGDTGSSSSSIKNQQFHSMSQPSLALLDPFLPVLALLKYRK
jgi:hypothetical protein